MSTRWAAPMLALLSVTAGCASLPPRKVYLLENESDAAVASAGGAPAVLRLERVLLPDYLDTTDILTRAGGHELRSSQTGRWGERLSLGITHALRADLAARLPTIVVAATQTNGGAVGQILVTVDTFEVWADGRCVLAASWTLLEKDAQGAVLTGHGAFKTPAAAGGSAGDATIIAAMDNAVSQLADGITTTVQRLGSLSDPRSPKDADVGRSQQANH